MPYFKYPRTYHLPWSPGVTSDDKVMKDTSVLKDLEYGVVCSVKMDGENTTLYSDHIHARSLDSKDHESRHWVKGLWSSIKHNIPPGWRICGENLFAKHSIHYEDLESYFTVFSIWNEFNECIPYEDTKIFCEMLGLTHTAVFYEGLWLPESIEGVLNSLFYENFPGHEGYVVRKAGSFKYEDFSTSVAKYVRKDHVQTDKHWMHNKLIPNKLR